MKYVVLLFVVLCYFFGFAPEEVAMQAKQQNMRHAKASVSLVGEVTSVEVKEGLSQYGLNFKATLKLKNTGTIPVIFLNESFSFPGAFMAEKPEDFKTGKLLTSSYGGMSCSQTSEKWISLRKELDQNNPPKEKTFILGPSEEKIINGEPVGFSILIDPSKGLSTKERESASWATIASVSQILVKLQMEVYPAWGLEPKCYGTSYGKKLQKRWRSLGHVWLEDIQSEPMTLDLKPSLNKLERK